MGNTAGTLNGITIQTPSELLLAVDKKVEKYDPTKDGENAPMFKETEQMGFFDLCFRYADCSDYLLVIFGMIGSTVNAASLPAMMLFFGEMIDGLFQQDGVGFLG